LSPSNGEIDEVSLQVVPRVDLRPAQGIDHLPPDTVGDQRLGAAAVLRRHVGIDVSFRVRHGESRMFCRAVDRIERCVASLTTESMLAMAASPFVARIGANARTIASIP
jgi:hypothetical protein